MATWQKEIMKLANDLCLNMERAKEIVLSTDNVVVPVGRDENQYKYNRAHAKLKVLIMNM